MDQKGRKKMNREKHEEDMCIEILRHKQETQRAIRK